MRPAHVQDIYPLTPLQEGLLFHALRDGDRGTYVVQTCYQLQGPLDAARLEAAWNALFQRHEALRTGYSYEQTRPFQVVLKERRCEFVVEDVRSLTTDEQQRRIDTYLVQDRARGFDLAADVLLRVRVFAREADVFDIVETHHHIVMDGWSAATLHRELGEIYDALTDARPISLPEPVRFAAFIKWLDTRDTAAATTFWQRYLEGFAHRTGVGALGEAAAGTTRVEHAFSLSKEQTAALNQLAAAHRVTLHTVTQALWAVLLCRYNDVDDVVFGSTVSIRPQTMATSSLVGLTINTIPKRVTCEPGATFGSLLANVQRDSLAAADHSSYPLQHIHAGIAGVDLFNHLLVFENYPIETALGAGRELAVDRFELHESTHYRFVAVIVPGDELRFRFTAADTTAAPGRLEALEGHLRTLIEGVLTNADVPVDALEIVPSTEREQVLTTFNATTTDYPRDVRIDALFDDVARRVPNRVAVVDADDAWTYGELRTKSDAIAARLVEAGVQPGNCVGVLMDRSVRMLASLVAILKAGAAYVPLDPSDPAPRIAYQVSATGCGVVVTSDALREKAPAGCRAVCIDAVEPARQPFVAARGDATSAAYVIFTSGSTGEPKGVVVEHRSVVRLVRNTNYITLGEGDRLLQTAPLSFDASTFEVWGALLNGASLRLTKHREVLDIDRIAGIIREDRITVLWLTASLFNQFVDRDVSMFAGIRALIAGGEALSPPHVRAFRAAHPDVALINGYGPTEGTTFTCCHRIVDVDGPVPIGAPIANTRVYVLDRRMRPVPVGVTGMLWIAGDGLARGYLGDPALTDERFVPCPFEPGARMYGSGDLAQWRPDGTVAFVGRGDTQVKIRGHRVECGEVEHALVEHQAVAEAVVTARRTRAGHHELIAYVVPSGAWDVATLRADLEGTLPAYLVPSRFVRLDALPLTLNQKVDRGALPDPDEADEASGDAYAAAETGVQRRLVEIWQEVLGRPRIGIDDHYFHLGGDSIKAILILARLRKAGLRCEVSAFFECPTIRRLAERVVPLDRAIPQERVTGRVPLTPIQRWLFTDVTGTISHFNQAVLLESDRRLDAAVVAGALEALVLHHDALRMTFRREADGIVQINKGSAPVVLELDADVDRMQASFALGSGPLVKAALVRRDGGDALIIAIHHLVVDAVSWRILLEDLATACRQLENGERVVLPAKTHSFKQWAEALQHRATSEETQREVAYWNQLASAPVVALAPPAENIAGGTRTLTEWLDESQTEQLLTRTAHAYNTQINDILLTALARALKQCEGVDRTLVSLESHGRSAAVGLDVSRTVGWFTSIYPVVLDIAGTDDIGSAIKAVKETLRRVPHDGIGFGLLKYLTDAPVATPTPALSFNYLGQFDAGAGNLRFSGASAGRTMADDIVLPGTLTINAAAIAGRLSVDATFDGAVVDGTRVAALLRAYVGELRAIVDHCRERTRTEFTPSDFTFSELSLPQLSALAESIAVEPADVVDVYRLSPMQQGLLFHALHETDGTAFFQQMAYRITGRLDVAAFEAAWNALASRHAVLRTAFAHAGLEEPLQVVLRERPVEFSVADLRAEGLDEHAAEARVADYMAADRRRPFDLGRDTLLRVAVLQTADDQFRMVWSFHHILLDGWCLGILYNELLAIYDALRAGERISLPPPRPYADYFRWLARQDRAAAAAFWRDYASGYDRPTGIPAMASAGSRDVRRPIGSHRFTLPQALTGALREVATANGVTLNTVVQGIWAVLLARFTAAPEVLFGVTVGGRPEEVTDVETMLGLFINTLPKRVAVDADRRFDDLLHGLQQDALAAARHEFFPLAEIQGMSALKQRLFDHILVYENFPEERLRERSDALAITYTDLYQELNYPLSVLVSPGEALDFQLLYDTGVHSRPQIVQIERFIVNLARQIAEGNARTVGTMSVWALDGEWRSVAVGDLSSSLVANDLRSAFEARLAELGVQRSDLVEVLNADGHPSPDGVTGDVVIGRTRPTGFKGSWRSNWVLEIVAEPTDWIAAGGSWMTAAALEHAVRNVPNVTECVVTKRAFGPVTFVAGRDVTADGIANVLNTTVAPALVDALTIVVLPAIPADGLDDVAVLDAQTIRALETKLRAVSGVARVVVLPALMETPAVAPTQTVHTDVAIAEAATAETIGDDVAALPLAFADGGDFDIDPAEPRTLADALYNAATTYAHKGTYYVNDDGTERFQSYADLLRDAQGVLNGLQQHGVHRGDSVILQFEDLYEHLTAFWACVLGGIRSVSVAVSPTYAEKTGVVTKLYNAWELLQRPLILTSAHLVPTINSLNALFECTGIRAVSLSGYPPVETTFRPDPHDVAFYQLTSGSTGIPKCIQETHFGIYHHVYGAAKRNAYTSDDVFLNWPPADHVGSLLTLYIKGVFLGVTQVAVRPDIILRAPLTWLDLIEKHKVTFTWCPNFGYKLTSDALRKTDRTWDLSTVRYFLNAAEQVTFPVVKEFLELTAPFGVPQHAMQPAYGMAETCTAMQYKNDFDIENGFHWVDKSTLKGILQKTSSRGRDAVCFVNLGRPMPGVKIRIVNDKHQVVPEGKIGSLHIAGNVVTPGYRDNPEANREALLGDGWLNTGDLGFILNGELSITGRQKEIIIIRGLNFYCYEIEDVVNTVEGVEPTFAGATAIDDPATGTEGLAVFFSPQPGVDLIEVNRAIRGRVTSAFGISPTYVIPIDRAVFPKTTSGKIQRLDMRKALEQGVYDEQIREIDAALRQRLVAGPPVGIALPRTAIAIHYEGSGADSALDSALVDVVLVETGNAFPVHVTRHDRLPTTVDGRVDRAALTALQVQPDAAAAARPLTDAEARLAKIWSDVLGVASPSIYANFFELGGDSIKAIQIMSRLHSAGWRCELKHLFEYQVIATLAPFLTQAAAVTEQAPVSGVVPVTPVQWRFFREFEGPKHHFNQAVLLTSAQRLEPAALRAALTAIVDHHDALRTTVRFDGPEVVQTIQRSMPLHFESLDLVGDGDAATTVQAHAARLHASLDLAHGPLLKAGHFRTAEDDRVLLVIHHLVVDGVSWRILFEDLTQGYLQAVAGQTVQLPPRTASFKEWGEQLVAAAHGGALDGELPFWSAIASADVPSLPARAASRGTHATSETRRFSLGEETTTALLSGIHHAFHTRINDILLTALARALTTWHGGARTRVTLESHGREFGALDVSRTVGWFTSIYPIVLDARPGDDLALQLQRVKETLRQVPGNGAGYGILRYLTGSLEDRSSDVIAFNYLGQLDQDLSQGVFRFADESSGEPVSGDSVLPYDLSFVGLTANGRFGASVNFSPERFDAADVQRLLDAFQAELVALVAFCAERPAHVARLAGVTAADVEDVYPLSPMQGGMLFEHLLKKDSAAYFLQFDHGIDGPLDVDRFEEAWNVLFARHSILRTAFVYAELEEPLQVVLRTRRIGFVVEDVRGLDPQRQQEYIDHAKAADRRRSFDLAADVLMRFSVFRTADSAYRVVWSFHHIILDGWCFGILYSEFLAVYQALVEGRVPTLAPAVPYARYIAWLQQVDREGAAHYWRNYLRDFEEITGLPRRRAAAAPTGATVHDYRFFAWDRETTERLQALAARQHVTLYTVLQSLWAVLLARYNGTDDVVFGQTVSGRPESIPGIEHIPGLFINTVPSRVRVSAAEPVSALLARVQREAVEGAAHHHYPLYRILADTPLGPSLFDHIIAFENYPFERALATASGRQTAFAVTDVKIFEQINFDLALFINAGETIQFRLEFDPAVHEAAIVDRLQGDLATLVETLLASEAGTVADLAVLKPSDVGRLVAGWNAGASAAHPAVPVHLLFELQAETTPDAPAIVCRGKTVSYRALNARANEIAHKLTAMGIGPESIVGVALERSADMVAALLGTMKTGAAYLPLDPKLPLERLRFTVEQSGLTTIVARPENTLGAVAPSPLWLGSRPLSPSTANLDRTVEADTVAYVIYTSGSTGQPKGVAVPHRALSNLVQCMRGRLGETARGRLLAVTTVTFDIAALELFVPLVAGGCVVLAAEDESRDPQRLAALIDEHDVAVLQATPATWGVLLEYWSGRRDFVALCGGEAMPAALATDLSLRAATVLNVYGPTETTVWSTAADVSAGLPAEVAIAPLGEPLAGTRIYVLHDMRPVPEGAPGELCIGGVGVARGYHRNPAMTAERFVPDPFASTPGERMYRTGDLVRWTTGGGLEFLGRIDQQVKIRGFRVEPGEIEAALATHPSVAASIVVRDTDTRTNDARLLAYVVPTDAAVHARDAGSRAQQVEQWQTAWDAAYEAAPLDTPVNLAGWVSSFTGQPIPEVEMQEWIDRTSERILSLRPQRVLDVGCGTGLLMARLAPHCDAYEGLDVAPHAVAAIRAAHGTAPWFSRVRLRTGTAADLDAFEPGSFDTVILNSVVQYFPDVEYLVSVLERAIRLVRPGGHIFVGDVRDRQRLDAFYAAVVAGRGGEVDHHRSRDEELVLESGFFDAFARLQPSVTRVDVWRKDGVFRNEMTEYRFDAVLSIGAPSEPTESEDVDWSTFAERPAARARARTALVSALATHLETRLPDYMRPSRIVMLDALPLTASGKVDRRRLPAPETAHDSQRITRTPGTPTEQQLAAIWCDVLGLQQIGVDDDFFRLGGHSLLAVRIVSNVQRTMSADLSLKDLFDAPTIAALAERIDRRARRSASARVPAIELRPEDRYAPFPLTPIQQAYWLGRDDAFELGSVSTHSYIELRCRELDVARLSRAWQRLVERHDMLRMAVLPNGEQQVHPPSARYDMTVVDLRPFEADVQRERLLATRARMSHQVLPAEGPLFEIVASVLSDAETLLHISFDALISDAWGTRVLAKELLSLYYRPEVALPALDLSFRDYVLAEREWHASDWYREALAYWTARLETLPPAPDLPLANDPAGLQAPHFRRRSATLPESDWTRLKARAASHGVTPSGLLLAAFAETLALWAREPRFTLNLTLFNRVPAHPQVNDIVGDFTSLILLEVEQLPGERFLDKARRVQGQLWKDLEHSRVNGVTVLRELSRVRGQRANMPVVFTSTLTLEAPNDGEAHLGDEVFGISQTPQVWLDHQVSEDRGRLLFNWDVVEELFPEGMIDDMFACYGDRLRRLASEDDGEWQRRDGLQLPPWQAEVRARINATAGAVPEGVLHTPFVAGLREHGSRDAVIAADRTLTHLQLARLAAGLARELRAAGARPNALVGIVMEKGWEQIVAAVAVSMSGAAYLPIDPALPAERRDYLLAHGGVEIVLTQSYVDARLEWAEGLRRVQVDRETFDADPSVLEAPKPTDLAYVIFTSGSTGLPKGVMIDHRGALNTVVDINERFGVRAGARVLALSSLSFDLSVYDIFGMLAAGGTVVVPAADATNDPEAWARLLVEHGVTVWNSVPALMQMLVDVVGASSERLASLRVCMLSGDWIPVPLAARMREQYPALALYSLGGATEASIWSIAHAVHDVPSDWRSVPYGTPLRNQEFHVLDAALNPCPTWKRGDLYIGGIGVALGYWRDSERTAASFITHPRTMQRLYRTGDVGLYRPDGVIEFLGRDDTQVKVRGHRIELGEIDAALQQHPAVKEAVAVAAGERENRQLAAFVVPHDAPVPVTQATVLAQAARLSGMSFDALGRTLRCLKQVPITGAPLPKYLYGSAGSLYPVQTYVAVPEGVIDALDAGLYYYDPARHALTWVGGGVAVDDPLSLIFVANLDAIGPMYGDLSLDFCALEVGYMAELLATAGDGVGVMPAPALNELLETGHLPIAAVRLSGGGSDASAFARPDIKLAVTVTDAIERAQFKFEQRGLRRPRATDTTFMLPHGAFSDVEREAIIARQSYREYRGGTVAAESLFALLRTAQSDDDLRLYVAIKPGRVEGIAGGTYRYDAARDALSRSRDYEDLAAAYGDGDAHNRQSFEAAAFACYLVTDAGQVDRHLVTAGRVSQRLMQRMTEHEVGLCPIGAVDAAICAPALGLADGERIVHSLLGGAIHPSQTRRWMQAVEPGVAISESVRSHLSRKLPHYMVPGRIIQLDALPLTANGKVDRQALQRLAANGSPADPPQIAVAMTDTEALIVRAWRELLPGAIGAQDNFFERGADSLLAARFVARMRDDFGVAVSLRDVFERPTAAALAVRVESVRIASAMQQAAAAGLQEGESEGVL